MITYCNQSIFDVGAQAIVNPVNTVGVMGKGLALEFKKRYPENFKHYRAACNHGLTVGTLFPFFTFQRDPEFILNVPTKTNWRDPSTLAIVNKGVCALIEFALFVELRTVAVPQLGCGLGGLQFELVKKNMEVCFNLAPKTNWIICIHNGKNNEEIKTAHS